jgi:hypothetical protein
MNLIEILACPTMILFGNAAKNSCKACYIEEDCDGMTMKLLRAGK